MRPYNFLRHNILYFNQFAFRTNHSTDMAASQFVDNLTQAIDNGNYSVSIFLDLSKAIDTCEHNILLCKLSHYGVRQTSPTFFIPTPKNHFLTSHPYQKFILCSRM